MRLIKPSFEIKIQEPGLNGLYKQIEMAGRICYKSEDKITEDSAKKFIDRLIDRDHTSVLEHGTVYLRYDYKANDDSNNIAFRLWSKYRNNKYSEAIQAQPVPRVPDGFVAITTNYRVLLQNGWLEDLQYLCEPTRYHEKRITVKFILSRSIAQEFTRHRVFSFSMESQRYCNYSKDKFNNEITFIIPSWMNVEEGNVTIDSFGCPAYDFLSGLGSAERSYFRLINKGWKPQQAREVLPNATKTELVMTGTAEQWEGFFKLRDDSKAHPQARELAKPLHEEFIKRGYINDLQK